MTQNGGIEFFDRDKKCVLKEEKKFHPKTVETLKKENQTLMMGSSRKRMPALSRGREGVGKSCVWGGVKKTKT